MNNIYFIIVCFFMPFLCERNEFTLEWSPSKKLTREDFLANPIKNSPFDAVTSATFQFQDMEWGNNEAKGNLIAIFYKKKSWIKFSDSLLLEHEQGHFDITEIFARRLRLKLKKHKFRSKFISKQLHDIYQTYIEGMISWQNLYDKETNLGKNRVKQLEWNDKISTELSKLEKVSETYVYIKW